MIPYTLIRLHCTVRRGDIFIVICFHPVSVFFSSGSAGNQDDFSFVRSLSAFCPLVLQAIKTIFPSFGLSLHFVLWFCRQSRRFFLRSVSLCILSSGPAGVHCHRASLHGWGGGGGEIFSVIILFSSGLCIFPLVLPAIRMIFFFVRSLHFVLWFCILLKQDDFSFIWSVLYFVFLF